MDNLKYFLNSITTKWLELQAVQKAIIVASFAGIITALFLALLFFSADSYVPLFPNDRSEKMDIGDVVTFLQGSNVPYRMKGNLVLVPQEKVNEIRSELSAYGLPRAPAGKGYELFDNNTWIKGEKELQMLELRALKGQLEQDISHFNNVRSANIILDIPPPKPFGGVQAKTKASVILNLNPGTRLTQQELRAISNHVAGAVRGLTPNMVAISDTNGKLYQAIDAEGDFDQIRNAEVALEDHIKAKIDGMLVTVVGYNNFYSTVQVVMNRNKIVQERKIYSGSVEGIELGSPVIESVTESNLRQNTGQDISPRELILGKSVQASSDTMENKTQESKQLAVPMDYIKITSTPGKVESISIGVLIDEASLANLPGNRNQNLANLKTDLQNQIETILKGYNVKVHQSVDIVNFDRTTPALAPVIQERIVSTPAKSNDTNMILAIITGLIALAILWSLMKLLSMKKIETPEPQAQPASLESLEKMLDDIKEESRRSPPRNGQNDLIKKILNSVDPSELGKYLQNFSAQTIADVLISLKPERVAAILHELPQDKQQEILTKLPADFRTLIQEI